MQVSRPEIKRINNNNNDNNNNKVRKEKWTNEESRSRIVMQCYLESGPKRRRYRNRMSTLWVEKGVLKVTEQRLVDRVYAIRRRKCVTEFEVEEITRELEKDYPVGKTSNNIRDTNQTKERKGKKIIMTLLIRKGKLAPTT